MDDVHITASTREFETPPVGSDQAYNLTFSPDITTAYQVGMDILCTHIRTYSVRRYIGVYSMYVLM